MALPEKPSGADLAKATEDLQRALDWHSSDAVRDHERRCTDFLARHPIFRNRHYVGMSLREARDLVMEQVRVFTQESGLFQFSDFVHDPERWAATLGPVTLVSGNMATLMSVIFGLFGATVMLVGTEYHHKTYQDEIQSLKVKGCFCLTELGHGSNVKSLETTAHFDAVNGEFVINTPSDSAQKYWIGGLAQHCTHAVVFAQLFADGADRGVHAFVVQIRSQTDGSLMPGVHVMDIGYKTGVHGVDNGRLWLTNVRVGRRALLDRFCKVDEMFGQLIIGRIGVAMGAILLSKLGLDIAVRYSLSRRQFAPSPGMPESLLLDYSSHQIRLLPLIAKAYALDIAANSFRKDVYANILRTGQSLSSYLDSIQTEFHIFASGLKPLATWSRQRTLQTCRECCGGQGLLAANIIGRLMTDNEIDTTWEGDNTVLLQQVSGYLLKDFARRMKSTNRFELLLQHITNQYVMPMTAFRRSNIESIDMYIDALRYRRELLLVKIAMTLNQTQSKKTAEERFEVWNLALPTMLELGLAQAELEVLTRFSVAVKPTDARILHRLCLLFAACTIEQHVAFYLQEGFLTSGTARDISALIRKLCWELRPYAAALVDAFAIDPRLADAPIAHDWLLANSRESIPGVSGPSYLTRVSKL
ncbi:unnamed protein product (mitochondrion) [Plasmodiophora brassicae]|uniref:Acyl-coenzyme A oxidase n=1 Tax=Plasmodiophora brassicae TaxID=37360 RepID=A0A3P3Y3H2_PLABS|nr:unnamed protein product [Plasmodiophora brassicae]